MHPTQDHLPHSVSHQGQLAKYTLLTILEYNKSDAKYWNIWHSISWTIQILKQTNTIGVEFGTFYKRFKRHCIQNKGIHNLLLPLHQCVLSTVLLYNPKSGCYFPEFCETKSMGKSLKRDSNP